MARLDDQLAEVLAYMNAGEHHKATELIMRLIAAHSKKPEVWLAGFDVMAVMGNRGRALAYLDGLDRCNKADSGKYHSGSQLEEIGWYAAGVARETERYRRNAGTIFGLWSALDLVSLHSALGEYEEVMDYSARATATFNELRLKSIPTSISLLETTITFSDYSGSMRPAQLAELLGQQRLWTEVMRVSSIPQHWAARDSPGGPLCVVFIASNLRLLEFECFLSPLLRGLNGGRITPHLLQLEDHQDDRTAALKKLAEIKGGSFTQMPNATAGELVAFVREELGAHVAIDLAGLGPGSRSDALAEQYAQVQLGWLGYPNSTGVASVHGRIVDAITDPIDTPWELPERRLRMPGACVCYQPSVLDAAISLEALAREPSPEATKQVVFGVFTIARSLSSRCVELWAEALKAAHGTRLVIRPHGMDDQESRERLAKRMEFILTRCGVADAKERLMVVTPIEDAQDRLEMYRNVDIMLDTYPYCSTIATCEAMWMNVPVITLALPDGPHASRIGASLLHAAGHDELVARSPEDFGRIAAELAADRPRLAGLHKTLREEMLSSKLCDAKLFAKRWEDVVIGAWEQRAK